MIYTWTINLKVDSADIEVETETGDTWRELACRDLQAMAHELPGPMGGEVTALAVIFGPDDPPRDERVDE